MATIWSENIIGLYNQGGGIIKDNVVPSTGYTWEIKKSHIMEMRTAIEGLFVLKFGSVPSGWAAFDAYQLSLGRRRFTAWTNNSWDRFYFSHVDDIRQIVNYLEAYLSYTVTSFTPIIPLYNNDGSLIVENSNTFSKVSSNEMNLLRNRINVLEGLAYTYLDYSLVYNGDFINTVLSPYMQTSVAEIDQSNLLVRYIPPPPSSMHEFQHIGRNATRFYFNDDNVGGDIYSNGYLRRYGMNVRDSRFHPGIISGLGHNLFDIKDPYFPNSFMLGLGNASLGSFDGVFEDCYIKITGYGVGIRIFSTYTGASGLPSPQNYSFCQYKCSSVYDDNTLYSEGRTGWTDYNGYLSPSSPSIYMTDNGQPVNNVFNGLNPLYPLSGLWLTDARDIRYREIKLFDNNTNFTILLRDGLPAYYMFPGRYCRLGVIMRSL